MSDVTIRDLIDRYEEKLETSENAAKAMLAACDELLTEMGEGIDLGRCQLCGEPVEDYTLTSDSHPEGVNLLVGDCCAGPDGGDQR